MSDENQELSRRYWKAAISSLPTAEKRDAAWEFYLERFAGNRAGDTLSGLILLLEANGVFLLTLPEKFHAELTQPITEQLNAMREEIHACVDSQRAILLSADAANEAMEEANKHLAAATIEFANKIRAVIQQIDTTALANRVHLQLESSIATPLRSALRNIPEQTKRLDEASKAAESKINEWHNLHFDGIIFNACFATLIVASTLFCLIWFRLH